MKREFVKGMFEQAGIEVLRMWELANGYWPEGYRDLRIDNPWWLVKTRGGLVEIGWRKRVISLDWSESIARVVVTEDNVTKSETNVHAYGYDALLLHLTKLAPHLIASPPLDGKKG